MKSGWLRTLAAIGIAAGVFCGASFSPAAAATTGTITGRVTVANTGAPISGVTATAASPSGSRSGVTDASGFYTIILLQPDTYTVTFSKAGYTTGTVHGVTVLQDQTASADAVLTPETRVIGKIAVTAAAASLVQKNQPADVYTISGAQLQAATGADALHKTLYEYMQALPGVTANGYPGQPRVRGGQVTDLSYEFDGIPIQDRITGFFTTNLSNIGVSNVELYTGGYGAEYGNAGTGVLNSVVKVGTYPHNGRVAFGVTGKDYNHYLTVEYGTAAADQRWSAYVGYDGVNSENVYNQGSVTYPNVLLGGYNGPGTVFTRDIVGNFHFRPTPRNDFQLLIQNGYGLFDFHYLLNGGTPGAPLLQLKPCYGAHSDPTNTITGGSGGVTSGTGIPCPNGLQFVPLPNGSGNKWNHYSGIGKLSWNHTINERSYMQFRLAENFNQYIFDQPLTDPNYANLETPAGPGCPPYPLRPYTPLLAATNGNQCTADIEDFYGDRSSHMYVANIDYDNQASDRVRYRLGINEEYDRNLFRYYLLNNWGSEGIYGQGGWPYNYLKDTIPTHLTGAYAQTDVHFRKLLVRPGLRWDREWYGIPGGAYSVGGFSPRFAGTYSFDDNNVLRGSYGVTNSLIGSGYVYRDFSSRYTPVTPGFSAAPQVNHNADLSFEHRFADGVTAIKFGPWFNKTDNYYTLYTPIVGTNPDGTPKLGKPVLSNAGHKNAFGAEFALSHVLNRDGLSWWITGTYDNYWTSSVSQTAFVNNPINQLLINQGFRARDPNNPLFSGSMYADWRMRGWEVLPFAYYQTQTFYDVYHTSGTSPSGAPNILPEKIAGAWWRANLTVLKHLSDKEDTTVGVRLTNLTNNTDFTAPCFNSSSGTGCYPFNGPQSGFTGAPRTFVKQYETQAPNRYEFFVIRKL